MKDIKLDRRSFLKGLLTAGAGLALGGLVYVHRSLANLLASDPSAIDRAVRDQKEGTITDVEAQATVESYMDGGSIPGDARVVHVHDPDATNWNGSGWYGDAINQTVVDAMILNGLQSLTGQSSWANIWDQLFSQVQPGGYVPGQKIAVKVCFNNSYPNGGCQGTGNRIDAVPQPVKSLMAGLLAAGVQEQDVWFYDATVLGRIIPDRFRLPILADYPNVQFHGRAICTGVIPVTHGDDPSLTVQFTDPGGVLTDRNLTDVLYNATYLINMPIIKRHGIHPVSMGFKNHFGSIDRITQGSPGDDLHRYIDPDEGVYSPYYSPMVDMFNNTNIKDKTILTLADALYGAFGADQVPRVSWNSFGDAPNSFLFSKDPVAIDCVMNDLLYAEINPRTDSYHYLFIAQDEGLGICEGTRANPGGDPWQTPYGSGYSQIEYVRITL